MIRQCSLFILPMLGSTFVNTRGTANRGQYFCIHAWPAKVLSAINDPLDGRYNDDDTECSNAVVCIKNQCLQCQ